MSLSCPHGVFQLRLAIVDLGFKITSLSLGVPHVSFERAYLVIAGILDGLL